MPHKTILHLTVKREWFDKIKSGEKTIEYREAKPYWTKRLKGMTFDSIIFVNGYMSDSPSITKTWIKTEKLKSGINTDLGISGPVYAVYFE